jgi:hypothetical protein
MPPDVGKDFAFPARFYIIRRAMPPAFFEAYALQMKGDEFRKAGGFPHIRAA